MTGRILFCRGQRVIVDGLEQFFQRAHPEKWENNVFKILADLWVSGVWSFGKIAKKYLSVTRNGESGRCAWVVQKLTRRWSQHDECTGMSRSFKARLEQIDARLRSDIFE